MTEGREAVVRDALDTWRKRARRFVMAATAVALLGIGVGIAVDLLAETPLKRLQRSGVLQVGSITGILNDRNSSIDVRVFAPGGPYLAAISVGVDSDFKIGETVAIRYDQNNPTHAVLARGTPSLGPLMQTVVTTVFAVAALVLIAAVVALRRLIVSRQPTRGNPRWLLAARSAKGRSGGVLLLDGTTAVASIRGALRWPVEIERISVAVFGEMDPGAIAVVVEPNGAQVQVGRVRAPLLIEQRVTIPRADECEAPEGIVRDALSDGGPLHGSGLRLTPDDWRYVRDQLLDRVTQEPVRFSEPAGVNTTRYGVMMVVHGHGGRPSMQVLTLWERSAASQLSLLTISTPHGSPGMTMPTSPGTG